MDEILVKRTLSGDKDAFNQLVAKYQTQVYGLAFNILRNFSDAEDLAQEAFLRAYLSLHQLRDEAKFGNWLYKITRNLCRRWLQNKTTQEKIAEGIRMNGMEGHVLSPDELAEAKELTEGVRNAIDALPEQERLIVTLYYMNGLTQHDIADFVGVSESTVRRRLRSLRTKLKGELLVMVQEDLQKHDLTEEFTNKVASRIVELEAAIRDAIGKPRGPILTSDLESLTELDANGVGITDLNGIEHCINLQRLDLQSNRMVDISPLSNLTKLQRLYLGASHINLLDDISPLSSLTNLKELSIRSNQISELSSLSRLTNLEELHLGSDQISDISPLSGLINLRKLGIWSNQISDISPLNRLVNLQWLSLSEAQVANVSPLSNLTKLQELYLQQNQISNIIPLNSLIDLKVLHLGNNQTSNISPVSKLLNLQRLYLVGNQISDIRPLNNLTNLQELALWQNQVINTSSLNQLTKLQRLGLSSNQISDISPLANLRDLGVLYLDNNQITDISALYGLERIGESRLGGWMREQNIGKIHLGLSNNQISDISPLVKNSGIGIGDGVDLRGNPLNHEAYKVHIPTLIERRVHVLFDPKP